MKASDIEDEQIIGIIREIVRTRGRKAFLSEIQGFCPVPAKVVMAKLRKLVRSGKVEGCACGCRGDFYVA